MRGRRKYLKPFSTVIPSHTLTTEEHLTDLSPKKIVDINLRRWPLSGTPLFSYSVSLTSFTLQSLNPYASLGEPSGNWHLGREGVTFGCNFPSRGFSDFLDVPISPLQFALLPLPSLRLR